MIQILTLFMLMTTLFVHPIHAQEFPQADFSALRFAGEGVVERVLAPHTIQLKDGRVIRLTGLDFPDLYESEEPGDISIIGQRVLEDMLRGQSIHLYQTKTKDKGRLNRMGHMLAHIVRLSDQAWVQGALLRLGAARVQTTKYNPQMAEQMYALEEQARAEKHGIWALPRFSVLTPENADEQLHRFGIVEGTIKDVALKKNRLYLNFGANWRTDFTISIAGEDRRSFSKTGLDPLQWAGQKVRVRGYLESYNGPYIEINHPAAFELLNAREEGLMVP